MSSTLVGEGAAELSSPKKAEGPARWRRRARGATRAGSRIRARARFGAHCASPQDAQTTRLGPGDGEARRGETRGDSSPGAKASGDAEGAQTGVARVRRGASARDCEDHACREHLRREMVP